MDKEYSIYTEDYRVDAYTNKSFYNRMAAITRANGANDEKNELFIQKMGELMPLERLLQLRQSHWSPEYYATVAAENNPEEKIYAIAMLIFS